MYISLLKHPNMPLDIVKKIFFEKSDYNIDFSWKARDEILKHPNLDEAFLNDIVERMGGVGHGQIAELKLILAHPNSSPQTIDKIVSIPARFSKKRPGMKLTPSPVELSPVINSTLPKSSVAEF